MALFQKKPQAGTSVPLYSVGANNTLLIIGLGNPGKEYKGTRHNIGFEAVEHFASKNEFPAWINKKDLKAELTVRTLGQNRVILAKPTTFMNNSGEAAQAIQHFYRVYNQSTLVVYDDVAIRFGQLRTRTGGTDGGHNGVKSIINHIGSDFGRLRIGIANDVSGKADTSNFVLGKFTSEEVAGLVPVLQETNAMLTEYIFSGQLPHETRAIMYG